MRITLPEFPLRVVYDKRQAVSLKKHLRAQSENQHWFFARPPFITSLEYFV